jgi:glycosyltransferase involved in cell wall biosynthesis
MRLLIVSDTFTPDVNGVARSLRQFAVGLIERGHHVEVVTTCGDDDDAIVRHVVNSMPVPGYATIRLGFASPRWFRELFHRVQPDVLYVATETALGISAIWVANAAGLPVVSGFHTNFHSYARDYHLAALQPAAEAVLRAVHNHTQRTLAPSQHTARQLREMGIQNVGVLGRGVNTDLFAPDARSLELRKQWGAGHDKPVAIYVGRVAAEKNLALLEQAFETFVRVCPGAPCVIVGDGPMLPELQARHPDWIFAGKRGGTDLAQHYASADVFLFPSVSETFGNVVIEALASGLVTVAFDYAAANEHIREGVEGLLAPLGDEAAFLQRVCEAGQRWDDDALRIMARVRARTLSWSAQVEQFETFLQQAIASSSASLHP